MITVNYRPPMRGMGVREQHLINSIRYLKPFGLFLTEFFHFRLSPTSYSTIFLNWKLDSTKPNHFQRTSRIRLSSYILRYLPSTSSLTMPQSPRGSIHSLFIMKSPLTFYGHSSCPTRLFIRSVLAPASFAA